MSYKRGCRVITLEATMYWKAALRFVEEIFENNMSQEFVEAP